METGQHDISPESVLLGVLNGTIPCLNPYDVLPAIRKAKPAHPVELRVGDGQHVWVSVDPGGSVRYTLRDLIQHRVTREQLLAVLRDAERRVTHWGQCVPAWARQILSNPETPLTEIPA